MLSHREATDVGLGRWFMMRLFDTISGRVGHGLTDPKAGPQVETRHCCIPHPKLSHAAVEKPGKI
jgi:hypothetical protein